MSSPLLPPQDRNTSDSAAAGLLELWRHPATSQKLLALGLLLASLAVGSYGVALLMQSSEHVLFSNLNEMEAANVVERLRAADVDARLSDNGRSVIIDASDLERARLAQASDGMPASSPSGWSLFDDTGFGMTDFQERVTFQRALEGEIARTVSVLAEVAEARVHLAIPEESIYTDEAIPKASISLTLHRPLEPRSIQAVVNLVASAVEGLTPQNVVVIDSFGRTLHAGGSDPLGDGLTDEQLARKAAIERELGQKAVSILEPLVGPGKVRARATVQMDFDRSEETIETFDPEGSVVRSQRLDEQRKGDSEALAAARGVPGTRANPPQPGAVDTAPTPDDPADPQNPDTPADANDAGGADAEGGDADEDAEQTASVGETDLSLTSKSETINYEVSKTVRHVSTPMGRVGRRSVAVVVDDAVVETEEGPQRTPYSDEQVQKFNALVIAALGLNEVDGDTVTVSNIAFDGTDIAEPAPEPSFLDQLGPFVPLIVKNLSWVVLLAGFYFMIFRPLMRKLAEPMPIRKVATALPESSPEQAQQMGLGAVSMGALPPPSESIAGDPNTPLLTRAQQMSQHSPEFAGNLVRNWLQEEADQ